MKDVNLLLGLDEEASEAQCEAAYQRLSNSLNKLKSVSPKDQAMVDRALGKLWQARQENVRHPDEKKVSDRFAERLRLGILCVASGMITFDQLSEAMAEQATSGAPLGEILQAKQFISQEELDGLLLGQDLIIGEGQCDSEGQRLLALDVVSEEMMMIALLEKRFASTSLKDALIRRNWLSETLWEAIFNC